MTKSRGLIGTIAALVVILAGAAFILSAAPRSAETASADLPTRAALSTDQAAEKSTRTPLPVVAMQPTALPPSPMAIAPTETLAPQPAAANPIQPAVFQPALAEQPTVIPAPPVKLVPNQVTIQFAPGTTLDQQKAYVQQLGGTIQQSLEALHTLVVTIPDVTAAEALPRSELVVQTEPDYYVSAQQSAPNDPFYSQQWALPVMQVPSAWPLLPSNAPLVAVAVIDSGICADHPDLAGRILPGYDFVQNDATPQDEFGHGCEVSGIIAANMSNGIGIAGVAPNARIMPLRVLDASGSGYYSNVAAAITYAADNGAQIINLSLGGTVPSTTLQNAVDYAVSKGVMVVAAAGNSYGGAVMYPAAYPNVVAVASVDTNLQISNFSAVGPEVDLRAPGRDIMSTSLDGSYIASNGTSFAAPQVAGIAALEIGRGKTLIIDGGIVHADVTAPTGTLTPTPQTNYDKHGNVIPQSADDAPVPTDTWAVILEPGSDPDAVATQLGYENLGQIGYLADTYLFRIPASGSSLQAAQDIASAFQANAQVISFEQQFEQKVYSRDPNDDPLTSPDQWHLHNSNGWVSLNLPTGWASGSSTGAGVQIAIVDDGLQYTHPDLAPHYIAGDSCDYSDSLPAGAGNCNDPDPAPLAPMINGTCGTTANCHGTSVAGVAVGADNPPVAVEQDAAYCGVGVAYGANLAGIRLTGNGSTSAVSEVDGLTYHYNANDIYNNSWGPKDDGIKLVGLDPLVAQAMLDAVTNGRGGLGSIYVWAAGNGRQNADNINADGHASSRFVIAVGAIKNSGVFADYSEPGASMLITAPSSSSSAGIVTDDLMGTAGYNTGNSADNDYTFNGLISDENYTCTKHFTGTSASAPMVSGVIALMLQANPNLTWRDVQYILMKTARPNAFDPDPNHLDPAEWQTNGAGRKISYNYGFGIVDAQAAVAAAADSNWTTLAPEKSASSPVVTVNTTIPDYNSAGVTSTLTLDANINVEHVEVVFNALHTWRGDLAVTLTSPDGTQSRLMEPRQHDDGDNYSNWTFTTVRDWGEHSAGVWTLHVADLSEQDEGTFQNWQLKVYGTAAPPKLPTPISPANDVQITTPLPWNTTTLTWNVSSVFADHLELQIDTVNPPLAAPIIIAGTPSSYVANLPLGTYYWRVRAVDTDPNTIEPDWSAITPRTFTIQTADNQPPARNYYTTASPVLSWMYVSWATAYQIEISTTSTFTPASRVYISPDGTGVDTPIPPNLLNFTVVDAVNLPDGLGEGTYYWRVRARKTNNTWNTIWSKYDSFIVDLP
ncbi:MAG: S8 family serine peptidase [Chloroflexota bacterium]